MLRVLAGAACFLVAQQSLGAAGILTITPWRVSTFTENVIAAVVFVCLGTYVAVRGTEDF